MFKIFKIKEGKTDQWKKWATYLIDHTPEVIETLKEEGLTSEKCILVGGHIIYMTQGKNLPASDKEINREHKKQMAECLEPMKGEVLFDFSTETK